jgi:deoxyribonuclease V
MALLGVGLMILAIDVQYAGEQGFVSAVSFDHWGAVEPGGIYETTCDAIAEYEPGNFYKRELPCILQLLEEHRLLPDVIVVDGYVTLDGQEKAGLGMHLYRALEGKSQVVGVAKRVFAGIGNQSEIFRGNSQKPLFVTSVGMDLEAAKRNIMEMHGDYRLPVLLKLVDRLCRDKAIEACQELT